jgi:hypothetical protein
MFVCVVVLGLLGLFCVVLTVDGMHFDPRALAIGSASVPVTSLASAWLVSILFPAALSSDGVYGHSFWGSRRFVGWQDIAAARTFTLLNLRWLRIYRTGDNKVTWVALFQSHKAEFREEIRRLAPADSPVLNHLQ